MYFYLVGIDYKAAPIDARDRIYRDRKAVTYFLDNDEACGVVMLVTCNRIEIYGMAEDAGEAVSRVAGLFAKFPDFAKYAYAKYGKEAVFRHALRLACGLESQLKGEPQILAQVKAWSSRNISYPHMKKMWDEAISYAEDIRRRAGLSDVSDNIATIIFEDLKKHLGTDGGAKIAVIGTGKIAELIAEYRPESFYLNFAAHKNYQKAKALAEKSYGRASLLTDLPKIISETDAVISATLSPHYILKTEHFSDALKNRSRPLYLYDLAVPRDIDPAAGSIEGLVLRNMDDLSGIFDESNRRRQKAVDLASYLVEETLRNYSENADGRHYQNRNAA